VEGRVTWITDTPEEIDRVEAAIHRARGIPIQHGPHDSVRVGRGPHGPWPVTTRHTERVEHPTRRESALRVTAEMEALDGQRLRVSDVSADEVTVSTRDAAELDATWTAEADDEPIRDGGGTKR
jgi:hypothetical protein